MIEPRTLKDFKFLIDVPLTPSETIQLVEKELRAEAIKHIKADRKEDYFNPETNISIAWCNEKHRCETCEWIKHFFNITEDDLK